MRNSLSEDEYDAILLDWRRHWWPRKQKLEREATTDDLLAALTKVEAPADRAVLIELLGNRAVARTIPAILPYIHNRSPRVRSEAADALGKIALGARRRSGDRAFHGVDLEFVGDALLRRLINERTHQDRNIWLAAALGSVGYRPAIPELMNELAYPNEWVRGMAAWSLGILRAQEAVEPLRRALTVETDSYARRQMEEALSEIARERVQHGE